MWSLVSGPIDGSAWVNLDLVFDWARMVKDQNRNETLNLNGIKQSEWFILNPSCQGLLLRCVCMRVCCALYTIIPQSKRATVAVKRWRHNLNKTAFNTCTILFECVCVFVAVCVACVVFVSY